MFEKLSPLDTFQNLICAKKNILFFLCSLAFSAALSSYSHYVFATLDHNDSGVITFEVSLITFVLYVVFICVIDFGKLETLDE